MRLRCDHIKREVTLADMRVDGEHAPFHAVCARCKRRQRHLEQLGIGAVDLRIAVVDLFAVAVEHLDLAESGLESFCKPELELRRRCANRTAGSRSRPLEASMRVTML